MDVICGAIQSRRTITFIYSNREREVEPHQLAYDRSGDLTLRAWQLSGTRPGWRNFHVAKASAFVASRSSFAGTRQGFVARHADFPRVVCTI